jgi:hypothetical protein
MRAYVEFAGDPYYGAGRCEATVEVADDGHCELISGDTGSLDLDDVYEAARAEAGLGLVACDGCASLKGVELVTYDAMVDGPGYIVTEHACAACRAVALRGAA